MHLGIEARLTAMPIQRVATQTNVCCNIELWELSETREGEIKKYRLRGGCSIPSDRFDRSNHRAIRGIGTVTIGRLVISYPEEHDGLESVFH